MLVVAPLSGHFSTLLRKTVETLLRDHDVYITDWKNARDVPWSVGPFGFDDYIEYVIRYIDTIGPDAHVLAVCQPCVQALAAVAIMAEDRHKALPRSLTLMAGPVDTRIAPTAVKRVGNVTAHRMVRGEPDRAGCHSPMPVSVAPCTRDSFNFLHSCR